MNRMKLNTMYAILMIIIIIVTIIMTIGKTLHTIILPQDQNCTLQRKNVKVNSMSKVENHHM